MVDDYQQIRQKLQDAFQKQDFTTALEIAKEIRDNFPDHYIAAYFNLAYIQALLKQIDDALAILASITELTDHIMIKHKIDKESMVCRLWTGFEQDLINYTEAHLIEAIRRGFRPDTQNIDFRFITHEISTYPLITVDLIPRWVMPGLIITHRSCLIQEYPEHYGKLWPHVPKDKVMRYDWR